MSQRKGWAIDDEGVECVLFTPRWKSGSKTFCTYEEIGMGRSEQDLCRICPMVCNLLDFPIHGADAAFEVSALKNGMIETQNR